MGQVKAVMVSSLAAKKLGLKLHLRIDDTHQSRNSKSELKSETIEDWKKWMRLMGVQFDSQSRVSERMAVLCSNATDLIKLGKATIDDRLSVEENVKMWTDATHSVLYLGSFGREVKLPLTLYLTTHLNSDGKLDDNSDGKSDVESNTKSSDGESGDKELSDTESNDGESGDKELSDTESNDGESGGEESGGEESGDKESSDKEVKTAMVKVKLFTIADGKLIPEPEFFNPVLDFDRNIAHTQLPRDYQSRESTYQAIQLGLHQAAVRGSLYSDSYDVSNWNATKIDYFTRLFLQGMPTTKKVDRWCRTTLDTDNARDDALYLATIPALLKRGILLDTLSALVGQHCASRTERCLTWNEVWCLNSRLIETHLQGNKPHLKVDVKRDSASSSTETKVEDPKLASSVDSSSPTKVTEDNKAAPIIHLPGGTNLLAGGKYNTMIRTYAAVIGDNWPLEFDEQLVDFLPPLVDEITGAMKFDDGKDDSSCSAEIKVTIPGYWDKLTPTLDDSKKFYVETMLASDSASKPTSHRTPRTLNRVEIATAVPINITNRMQTFLIDRPTGKVELSDVLNPEPMVCASAMGEASMKEIKEGDIFKINRHGYFYCTRAYDDERFDKNMEILFIPSSMPTSSWPGTFCGKLVPSD